MKLTSLLTTIFLITLTVLPAPAADADSWMKNGLIHPKVFLNHAQELNLTAEQQSKVNAITTPAKSQVEPLESALKKAQDELETLLRNPESSVPDADAKLTSVLDAESALKHFQLKTLISLRQILTPEQRTQALALAARKTDGGLEAKVRAEAERLKTAYEALGLPLTDGLKKRGKQIEEMIKDGGIERALQALDKLATESGINHPPAKEPLDFSKLSTGDTDVEKLKQRLDALQEKAKEVISVEVISKLLQAREALEKAKENSDADLAGRILTFAETLLEKH